MEVFDLATVELVRPDGSVEMFKSSRDENIRFVFTEG